MKIELYKEDIGNGLRFGNGILGNTNSNYSREVTTICLEEGEIFYSLSGEHKNFKDRECPKGISRCYYTPCVVELSVKNNVLHSCVTHKDYTYILESYNNMEWTYVAGKTFIPVTIRYTECDSDGRLEEKEIDIEEALKTIRYMSKDAPFGFSKVKKDEVVIRSTYGHDFDIIMNEELRKRLEKN